jgi:ABC-2 type transport system permease protein
MGYQFAPLSVGWLIAVPLIWTTFSLVVFAVNFKKVMGYE